MAGEEAASVTRQLLAFARQQASEPQLLDLNIVLTDLEPLLRRIVEENIRLEMVLARDLGDIKNDRSQLSQVILNLVANARDAMKRGGRLTIETSNTYLGEAYARDHLDVVPGPYVQLSVTDSGEGMDKETISRIFEPFFTTKEHGAGSGLGLATVYGIVRHGGGHIWVYSEPGRGTTFKIYLPRLTGAADGEETGAELEEISVGSETILLVEDSKLLARVTQDFLASDRLPGAGGRGSFRGLACRWRVSGPDPPAADRRGHAAYEWPGALRGTVEEAPGRQSLVHVRAHGRSDFAECTAG